MPTPTLIFIIIFIMTFILFPFISKGGWDKLAYYYKTNIPFNGTNAGTITARINSYIYWNSIVFKYNDEGMYLKNKTLLDLFPSTPVFIAWSEVKALSIKGPLFGTEVTLVISRFVFIASIAIIIAS